MQLFERRNLMKSIGTGQVAQLFVFTMTLGVYVSDRRNIEFAWLGP